MENTGSDDFYRKPLDINKLTRSVMSKMKNYQNLVDKFCIYTVPRDLRELNPKAYTPAIVSIGPLHHGKGEYQRMELLKSRYLHDFLKRCKLTPKEYVDNILKFELPLRHSYAQMPPFSKEKFLEIMAVDGAFLLEYFLKCLRYMRFRDIMFDILMLENQLPFFLLESLFELLKKSDSGVESSLTEIVAKAIIGAVGWNWLETGNVVAGQVNHLVDFIGICLRPSSKLEQCKILTTPKTVSELRRAGVRFKPISSKSFYDLKFSNGILQFPKFKWTDRIDVVLGNIQAYEQCHPSSGFMNDYIFLMYLLVNRKEDVDLLVRYGCIESRLQDNKAALAKINILGQSRFALTDNFYYGGLIKDLNAYCKTPWHQLLKQKLASLL